MSGVAMQRNAWGVEALQESLASKILAVYLRRDWPERAGFLRRSPIRSAEIQDLDVKICPGTRVHVLTDSLSNGMVPIRLLRSWNDQASDDHEDEDLGEPGPFY